MNKRTFIMLSSLSMLLCMGGAQVANAIHPTASINMLAEDDGDQTFSTTDGQNSVTLKKSADGKTLTISGKGDLTKLETTSDNNFINALKERATVQTIKFVNESTVPLYINNNIIWAILYPKENNPANTELETLDMGAATVNESPSFFYQNNSDYSYYWGQLKINEITLPLVKEVEYGTMALPASFIHTKDGSSTLATTWSGVIGEVYTTIGRPSKIIVPEGYTTIADSAFCGANGVETFELPTTVTTIGNSAFKLCSKLTKINLPDNLTSIGNMGFWSCAALANITFPDSLKAIGHSAFANDLELKQITLNKGLEIIGNCAFYRSSSTNDQKVLQVPTNVKYMGPGAFYGRRFMDVYYYGDKAPLSPYGTLDESQYTEASAFGAEVHMGNNGFTPASYDGSSTCGNISSGYANRENYINNGNYIAVLHFRSDIKNDSAKTFTDITRKYEHWLTKKVDYQGNETGETYWYPADKKQVGNETTSLSFSNQSITDPGQVNPGYEDTALGSQLIWPSQSQWMRSYICSSNGYEWDGTTTYRPQLSEAEKELMKSQESWMANYSDDDLSKLAYMSTRQFVIVSRDITEGDDPDKKKVDITGERWWSLCLPCDVTKKEVDRVFGENSRFCLFSKVVRKNVVLDKDGNKHTDTQRNEIHLYFQNDTYKNKYTRNADGSWTKTDEMPSDDDVVLYAHTPYMVWPAKRKDDGSAYVLANFTTKEGDALASVVTTKRDTLNTTTNTADSVAIKYTFTGNYRSQITGTDSEGKVTQTSVKAPQYSYVFGRRKTDYDDGRNSKFWFTSATNVAWKANKCIVEREIAADNEDEYESFIKGALNQSSGAEETEAKQFSIFGDDDDDQPTAVEKVIFHYGNDNSDARIYNLNGQLVSTDGSKDGLAKGIYIQNGKKFVVK